MECGWLDSLKDFIENTITVICPTVAVFSLYELPTREIVLCRKWIQD